MNNRGVHGGIATSVPLTKAMFNNVAFIIVSIIVLIFNSDLFGKETIFAKKSGRVSRWI